MTEDLHLAGQLYLWFEIAAFVCLYFWFQSVFVAAIQATYYGHRVLNFTYAGLTIVFHMIAIFCWIGVSEVDFGEEVAETEEPDRGDRLDLYVATSPQISIVIVLFQLFALSIFILPHWERKKDIVEENIKVVQDEGTGAEEPEEIVQEIIS
jgi:hypothetical protein